MYVAVDFETTSLDYHGLRPIQIGIAHTPIFPPSASDYVSVGFDINWEIGEYGLEVDPEALKINGFTLERIFWPEEGYHSNQAIDEEVSSILRKITEDLHMRGQDDELIPLGWNVGKFDMDIMRRYLPESYGRFSHRTRELNTAVALASEILLIDYKDLKDDIKQASESKVKEHHADMAGTWHDAEFDALASLYAWDLVKQRMLDEVMAPD